jgi:hypothetical protein
MHPFVVLERFFDRKNICIFPREKHLVSQILGCHCKQPVVKPETSSPITDFDRRAGDEDITVHIAARDRAALPWMIRRVPQSHLNHIYFLAANSLQENMLGHIFGIEDCPLF